MQQDVSLFDVNENGEMVYMPGEENGNVGDVSAPSDEVGDMVLDPEDVPENVVETEEETSSLDFLDAGGDGVPVVLSEEVTAAILAASPAGGSIGSSTLDYFDRVVSGLPAHYKYIAYRTNSDDSYDAVLYYGSDFEVSDHSIVFEDAVQLEVDRVTTSGYNNETRYYSNQVSDVLLNFEQSGNIVYYTNAAVGYPVLGGVVYSLGFAPLLSTALIGALSVVLLSKLLFRR